MNYAGDLLEAYDKYIQTAFEARLPETGWCPVCVSEFAEIEYVNVWKTRQPGENPFAYMLNEKPTETETLKQRAIVLENEERQHHGTANLLSRSGLPRGVHCRNSR